VASWLVLSPPDREVRARALALVGDIVLYFWEKHSASLYPGIYAGTGEFNTSGNPTMD